MPSLYNVNLRQRTCYLFLCYSCLCNTIATVECFGFFNLIQDGFAFSDCLMTKPGCGQLMLVRHLGHVFKVAHNTKSLRYLWLYCTKKNRLKLCKIHITGQLVTSKSPLFCC